VEIKKVREFIENLNQDKIVFDNHFYKRCKERPIDEGMVRNLLSRPDKIERIEKGNKERFKIWFFLSRKYSLVIIIEISITPKILKVISAWNSNKKWQKQLKQ
jgi:hypothetical protein